MEKKYVLLKNDTIEVFSHILYRIVALRDFGDVKTADLGGYIEKEENLSHEGTCWVSGNAQVYGNAKIYGDAQVAEYAKVFGDAQIYGNALVDGGSRVYGNAEVSGDAEVSGNAQVYGNAKIYGDVQVDGNSRVLKNAKVSGDTEVSNDVVLSGNANIKFTRDYCNISGFGSKCRSTTFYKNIDNDIEVQCGCFHGTLDEFRQKVKETHGDNKYAKEYLAIADVVELRLNGKDEEIYDRRE